SRHCGGRPGRLGDARLPRTTARACRTRQPRHQPPLGPGARRAGHGASQRAGMSDAADNTANSATIARRRAMVLLPLAVFLGLVPLFLCRLYSGDPGLIPSALIGHPAPQTTLPPVAGLERDGTPVPGLDPASFIGAVTVVNVWASWCVPCHDE